MTIKQSVYDNLNPTQRSSAMLEAVKRGDHAEVERLIGGVERKIYEQPDAGFTDELISQMLADNKIDDKAAAYKTLLALISRKETTGTKVHEQTGPNPYLATALAAVTKSETNAEPAHCECGKLIDDL